MVGDWANFAVMIGGASGALTGLLFVGVSFNHDAIRKHPRLRATAAQTLAQFVLPLVIAAALLIPDQVRPALGLELVGIGLITAAVLLNLSRHKKVEPFDRGNTLSFVFAHRSANLTSPAFCVLAGGLWLGHVGGSLYWLVPAVLSSLLQGVLNAWLFLIAEPR